MRKLTYALAVVLLWLGLVMQAGHALFLDSATLAGNSLLTGNAGLEISNSQNPTSTIYEESRPGFSYNLAPGESDSRFFLLKNTSASDIPLDITVQAVPQGTAATELLSGFQLEFTPVNGEGSPTGPPVGGTLGALYGPQTPLGASVPKGQTQRFRVKASLGASFTLQNEAAAYDLVFTGTQHLAP